MLVRASSLPLDLTDHEHVGYDRGHKQCTSQRGRGVGQWDIPPYQSTVKLMLMNTRSTWSQYVCHIRAALLLIPSQWANYPSSEDR
jgi:hypothetical protein